MIDPFPIRYRRALEDTQLRQSLLAFQQRWRTTRDELVSEIDFEAERAKLAAVKDEVIANLPAYLEQFKTSASRLGATTYEAETAEDAVRYVVGLAQLHGIHNVIKSKSMLSEEIELNHGLETAGLQVVETDLGEWIIQLAGERPSHLTVPAIHKNRRQIADLLSRVTGKKVSREDIGEQIRVARDALREEFLAGQMGISGANAIIAETGTVMLVTNEGNAELVTSIPRIHIVLVGLEKLLPTLDDAMLQLNLLAPSATGQRTTTYVSWITGPTAPDQEVHVVLVNNGRTAMRSSPLFRDALRCIRCGACSTVCPAYGVVGGHVFGYIYSGAIGLVNTPFHHGLEHDIGPQSLCVSCNACQTVCPVDIPLPRQILDTRSEVVQETGLPAFQRVGLELWTRPGISQLGLRLGAKLQKPLQRGPYLAVPGLGELTSWRKLPALASRPFRDQYHPVEPVAGPLGRTLEGRTIAYFVQCLTDWLYPEMARAIIEVLTGLGAAVRFPRAQHCCGLPAWDSGDRERAKQMAKQTIATLERCQADYIVSGGTSCLVAIVHEYPHLFADDPSWQERASRLGEKTLDFTSFMSRIARLPEGAMAVDEPRAAYHYFCQSYNVLGIRDQPFQLLRDVCGLTIEPMPEANVCCGFGGSVSFKRPELSAGILRRKLHNLDESGAPLLVTDNPGCIMHLRGGIAASGREVEVKHTAEIVAAALRRSTA